MRMRRICLIAKLLFSRNNTFKPSVLIDLYYQNKAFYNKLLMLFTAYVTVSGWRTNGGIKGRVTYSMQGMMSKKTDGYYPLV